MVRSKRLASATNRRQVLATLGVAGIGGFAGCLGDDDDDDTGDDDDGIADDGDDDTPPDDDDDDGLQRRHDSISISNIAPPELQEWNLWNPDGGEDFAARRYYTPGYSTSWDPIETYYDGHTWTVGDKEVALVCMTTEVEIHDNQSYTVQIRDDIPDWQGNIVTLDDMMYSSEMEHYFEKFEDDDWEPWEDDDSTVLHDEFSYTTNLDSPSPMSSLEWRAGFDQRWGGNHYYREDNWMVPYLERFEDAATEDELEEIRGDLESESIDGWHILENQLGHGPYVFDADDATETEIRGYLNEDHPAAEYIDIPEVIVHFAENDTERDNLLFERGDYSIVDGVHTEVDLETLVDEAPDGFSQQVVYPEVGGGDQILFNWDHKDLGNRWVRRACVEATHFPNMLLNAGQEVSAAAASNNQYWSYMSSNILETYVDDDVLNQLYQHTPESNFEQAAEFMERGGYTQNSDGLWVDENDDPVQIEFLGGYNDERPIYMETMRSNLEEFGFQGDLVILDGQPMFDRIEENQYDISVIHLGTAGPYPWRYYRTTPGWQELTCIRQVQGVQDWVWEWEVPEEERPEYDVQGRDLHPVIPEEPGALEVEGDGIQLDLVDLMIELRDAEISFERRSEITELIARWANFEQPDAWMMEGQLTGFLGDDDYVYPDSVEGRVAAGETNNHQEYLVQTGMVQPKYDEI